MKVDNQSPNPDIDRKTQRIAQKNTGIAIMLGLFFGPLGYVYLRAWRMVLLNVVTLNFFLFGIILVPIHCGSIIRTARKDVRSAKVAKTYTEDKRGWKAELTSD